MPWKILTTQTEIIAIHAALLPTNPKGEILCFGDWTNPSASTHTRLYTIDPEAVSGFAMADLPNTNAFCGGQSFLADGRLLVGGGTVDWPQLAADQQIPQGGNPHAHHYHGDRACWTYLPIARKWQRVKDMNFQPGSDSIGGGRWYPTLVTLSNGEVFAAGGHPDISDTFEGRHNNTTPERYQTALNKWALLTAERTSTSGVVNDSFPRYHLLPDGRLFSDTTGNSSQKQIYDPYSGKWVGTDVQFTNWDGFYDYGSSGTSVLLPLMPPNYPVRILATNGAKSYRLDLTAMKWENTPARVGPAAGKIRNNCCAVILPTGKVFMSGGVEAPVAPNAPVIPVLQPELYDPGLNFTAGDFSGAEQWVNLPNTDAAVVPRGYHSVALLLPDGRVWTAGSTEGSLGATEEAEKRVEVYEPDYFAKAGRPEITSVAGNVSYNQSFVITTPQAASIKRVALIRCGSVTHAFDSDQRYVGLTFQKGEGNTLVATAPPNGNLAPPGYYMLWLVDSQERPCKLAKFIRVSAQHCDISLDISTYSKVEAQAAGSPALFSKAIYVVYDGFLPGEVDTPTITLRRPNNTVPPGMVAQLQSVSYEAGQTAADVAQRIVFCYDVIFNNTQSFDQIPVADAFQTVTFRADMRHFSCQVPLTLSKNPNPFMRDGDPPWLSVDVRVFKISAGETPALAAGIPQNADIDTAPFDFIQGVLTKYNQLAGQANHPFDSINPSQPGSRLALYSHDNDGNRVFNYAVARVRYRAPVGIDADQVKLFFRLCTTGWSGLDYSTDLSYRRAGNGPGAAPLLGLIGGSINTIPCFASPRIDFMPLQTDPFNIRTLKGAGNSEVHNYFGCWLDINDDVERFPEEPLNDGPFTPLPLFNNLRTVGELLRGLHQCLVAEIHYTQDPIANGATCGTSDNLSQRNILLDLSDNPGAGATHLVQHTFELKPTVILAAGQVTPLLATETTHAIDISRVGLDELMIEWGNLPRDTHATLYFNSIDANNVLQLASLRNGPANLSSQAESTVQCLVTDVSFVPIPSSTKAIPVLLTLQLPPSVVTGQHFKIVARQIQRRTRRIIGTFQFDVRVTTAANIVPELRHNFAVLKHIGTKIANGNRWYAIWQRYLGQFADRLRAFGQDPDAIPPSRRGDHPEDANPPEKPGDGNDQRRCFTGKVTTLNYDCFGEFVSFVVSNCDTSRTYQTRERGIEELARRACCSRATVTVCTREPGLNVPYRIVWRC